MADIAEELNERFASGNTIPPDVLAELQSVARLHSLSAEELFFKWESYSMKMGESTSLDLTTVRAFKKDVQEILERSSREKQSGRGEKRTIHATPRGGGDDMYGMLDSLASSTPAIRTNGSSKRKASYETPLVPKYTKAEFHSSPPTGEMPVTKRNGPAPIPFDERHNAGQIVETLNDHLLPFTPPVAPFEESRIKLTANTDLKKFYYKPLAMHLSEASEVLDDRIDEFLGIIQAHHKLDDSAFGSAASKSTSEIIAVGRICCDHAESKSNIASLMLEMSRRAGAGRRASLKFDNLTTAYEFFPGQIVALRGINASGEYFSVNEVLEIPLLPPAASESSTISSTNARLEFPDCNAQQSSALNIIISAGPYTADSNLDFEPLHALCAQVLSTSADALILIGPLLDIEHPKVALGDFDLPNDPSVNPDQATLSDVFRLLIGAPLRRLAASIPALTIILVPSVRDAINKHVSWPQEPFSKKDLGLPRQAKTVTNPVTISLNEIVVGISAQDILYDLRREEVAVRRPTEPDMLARLPRHLIQQRHFFPLFPPVERRYLPRTGTAEGLATGLPLEISYSKLAEWPSVRPDVLILPGALPPFAKVVESVLVINPGTLSKRKGPGTYAQMTIHPLQLKLDEEEEQAMDTDLRFGHRVFERARVDVVRI